MPARPLVLVAACFAALTLQAAPAIHKCQVNGTTVYQQDPCPATTPRRQPTAAELNAERQRRMAQAAREAASAAGNGAPTRPPLPAVSPAFHCDGRRHCSQMRSCDEAHQFLRHCPGVEMDGDGDGIPCERQWCGR